MAQRGAELNILLCSLPQHGWHPRLHLFLLSTNIPVSTDRNSLANIAFVAPNEYLSGKMVAAVKGGESRPTTEPLVKRSGANSGVEGVGCSPYSSLDS